MYQGIHIMSDKSSSIRGDYALDVLPEEKKMTMAELMEDDKSTGSNDRVIDDSKETRDPLDLIKLPLEQRKAILAEAATEAQVEYLTNPELTDFEAFGANDFYDETP